MFDNSIGFCTSLDNCPIVKEQLELKQLSKIKICNSQLRLVCCPISSDLKINTLKVAETTSRPMRISEKMCKEYAKSVLYKINIKSLVLGEPPIEKIINKCKHQSVPLIVGGVEAKQSEFPHQALLGYKNGRSNEWACGGSLISPKFVLTAAHCLRSNRLGEVKFVKLGMNERLQNERVLIVGVAEIFVYPNYNSILAKEDIGLIKLNANVPINEHILPICLPTRNYNSDKAIVTGFGLNEHDNYSDKLIKVTLEKFSYEECEESYSRIDRKTMLCYGHHSERKDSCNGDSGGPLQIRNEEVNCTYIQLGIVSFGLQECGIVGVSAVYVNVYNYLDWIENIVWNEERYFF